jgi:CRISPR system Cascade subunit CasC
MSTFIQLHFLTCYPPANLNRDDLGRPKTAVVGGAERLRISSQSLKRAWRTSEVFQKALAGNLGVRTKEMGVKIFEALTLGRTLEDVLAGAAGKGKLATVTEAKARAIAKAVAGVFGSLKTADKDQPHVELETAQLAHFSPEEIKAASAVAETCRAEGREPNEDELDLLRRECSAADIAMFGRMLADAPRHNVEAAVQVAHAFGVEKAAVEDDFFTAVDDLNRPGEESGAGHMGVVEFGAGLFYLYLCVNRDLLVENLGGDAGLAGRALAALVEAAATVAPTGKQASFASRAYASFGLAEKGEAQPRSLAVAFLSPVRGDDVLAEACKRLLAAKERLGRVYGQDPKSVSFNAQSGEGTLSALLDFLKE